MMAAATNGWWRFAGEFYDRAWALYKLMETVSPHHQRMDLPVVATDDAR